MDLKVKGVLVNLGYSNWLNPIGDINVYQKEVPLGDLTFMISVNVQPHIVVFSSHINKGQGNFTGLSNKYSEYPENLDEDKIKLIEMFLVRVSSNQASDFNLIVGDFRK